jgi:hypothetical protein
MVESNVESKSGNADMRRCEYEIKEAHTFDKLKNYRNDYERALRSETADMVRIE